jgi:hypothetical protein
MINMHEELERVFDTFPKYHKKILLGYFNAQVSREDFQTDQRNESLLAINNDSGIRVVNFATS